MADGSVIFDTKLDQSGLKTGLSQLAGTVGSGIKTALAAAGTALAGLGTYAFSVGSDFESAISNVAATMGKTTDQIQEITEKAKELGASTAFSATEAAEGFNILAQSGLTAEDQLSSIDSVLNLAAAGEMEMADAAGYLTTTVKAFSVSAREANISMEDTSRLADLYAKGATLANTSTAQFGDAMTGAASMAGSFNQSIDTTGTLLLALAEKGYQGSEAGTYLARAMSDLYSPTANAQKALAELGVSAYDSSGKQRDMIDVVGDLQQAFSTMTEEERAAYSGMIFTSAGLKAFNSIAGSTKEELEALKGNFVDCAGSAEQMAETKLDNLKGDIIKLKSATEGFGNDIYENMKQPLRAFVQEGTSLVNELHQALEENGLSGLAGAVGDALSQAINMVAQYAPGLVKAAVDLVRAFVNGIAESAPQLATVAIEIVTTLLDGFSTISADLVRLGGELIISLCNGIASNSGNIITTITSGVSLISTTIAEYLPQVVQAGIQMIGALANGLIEAAPQLVEAVVSLIPQIVSAITENVSAFIDAALQVVNALVAALPDIIEAIVDALPEIIASIISALVELTPQIVMCGVELFTALITNLPDIIATIIAAIPEIIKSIKDAILEKKGEIISAGENLLKGMAEGIGNAIGTVVAKAREAAQKVVSSVKSLFGIASPSKLFKNVIGKNLMLGLAEGITDEADVAVSAAEKAAKEISEVNYDMLADKMEVAVLTSRVDTAHSISAPNEYEKYDFGADDTSGDRSMSEDEAVTLLRNILSTIRSMQQTRGGTLDLMAVARALLPYMRKAEKITGVSYIDR